MLEGLETSRRDRDLTIDAQKRFIADASHELRSPLTSIRANAGFLVDRQDASESDRLDATRDIAHEADRMSGLIDDLLMLARSDVRADATKDFTPVDLGTIARSVQRRARNLELSVEVRAPDTAIVRRLDGELAELIWLLVDNADLHGGAEALVTIDREDEDVVLEVIDNGSGVPDEALDRVFDRFHRADPARSGSGYGLGLAIARSITERHGGTIGVANGPDGGAAFTVRLPAAN
jgi:signal transduction histidine kinase